eukprot:m.206240 g.206240  ORF g.206240 m.206240 type:complete len:51 (+) comp18895_c0_seq1:390-542(+)
MCSVAWWNMKCDYFVVRYDPFCIHFTAGVAIDENSCKIYGTTLFVHVKRP